MPRKVAAFMLAYALASNVASAQNSPRIASTSLCGDTYLRALAPDQIAALSWQSRDKISLATEMQKALPQAWDNPELLASLQTDIIVLGPGEGRVSQRILADTNTTFHALTWGEDFDTVMTNFTYLSEAVGTDPKAIITDLKTRLDTLKSRAAHRGTTPKILYLSRSGGSAGAGTYVDAAIKATGSENIMTAPGWQNPDPEFLVSLKPDLIITSFFVDGYESVNASSYRSRPVTDFIKRHPRLDIPGALWPCAGPTLIDVAERIADKLETLE